MDGGGSYGEPRETKTVESQESQSAEEEVIMATIDTYEPWCWQRRVRGKSIAGHLGRFKNTANASW